MEDSLGRKQERPLAERSQRVLLERSARSCANALRDFMIQHRAAIEKVINTDDEEVVRNTMLILASVADRLRKEERY